MEAIEVREKVEEIKPNAIIYASNWWGHRTPGSAGYIITKDGELYSYQYYSRVTEDMKDFCKNYFTKVKKVSEQFFKDIDNYYEENLKGKEFPVVRMFDASFTVAMKGVVIENYFEIYNEISEIIKEEIKREN